MSYTDIRGGSRAGWEGIWGGLSRNPSELSASVTRRVVWGNGCAVTMICCMHPLSPRAAPSACSAARTHTPTQTSLHMNCKIFQEKTICDKNNPNKITDQFIITLQHERIMPQCQLHDLHKINQIWIMCKHVQYPSVQHLKKTFFTPVDGIFISHFFPRTTFHLSVPIKTHSYTLYFVSHFPPLLLCHPGCRLQCEPLNMSCEHVHLVVRVITCCLSVYKMLVFVRRFQACYVYKHTVVKHVKAASPPTLDAH